jgi:hypothetical protein
MILFFLYIFISLQSISMYFCQRWKKKRKVKFCRSIPLHGSQLGAHLSLRDIWHFVQISFFFFCTTGGRWYWHLVEGTKDATKHSVMHDTSPPYQRIIYPNISKLLKLWKLAITSNLGILLHYTSKIWCFRKHITKGSIRTKSLKILNCIRVQWSEF